MPPAAHFLLYWVEVLVTGQQPGGDGVRKSSTWVEEGRSVTMAGGNWNNPWKLTAIALALVGATALATGLVVANWTGKTADKQATVADKQPGSAAPRVAQAPAAPTPAVPTQSAIAACNQAAATQSGHRDKTVDTVKDAGIGALAGAAVGAAGGAIAGGGKGAGTGAAIGGLVGAGGGTLYGLNENQKHDQRYRDAYASCMRSRGYTG
jgi:hypothetical protein